MRCNTFFFFQNYVSPSLSFFSLWLFFFPACCKEELLALTQTNNVDLARDPTPVTCSLFFSSALTSPVLHRHSATETVGVVMGAPPESLNARFGSRRGTVLRPGLWSSEDLRLFGCQFSDVRTSQLRGNAATPAEDNSAAIDLDDRWVSWVIGLGSNRASPFVKEGSMQNLLCRGSLYTKLR